MAKYTANQQKEVNKIKSLIEEIRYNVANNIHCNVFVSEEDNNKEDERDRESVKTNTFTIFSKDTRTLKKMEVNGEIEILSTNGFADVIRPITF